MSDLPAIRLNAMRQYFASGATRSYAFRRDQLKKFKKAIQEHENEIHKALHADLGKSPEESWVTETGFLLSEINAILKDLRIWMRPERVGTNLVNFPSSSRVMKEPMGLVLIIGPWNYPFQLLFTPLAGAIAAGNCALLKSSEFAPATSAIMEKIISKTFAPEYISLVSGDGAEVVPALMNATRFDHVFYTGSTAVGKIIYRMAAEKLVPVTLELGGKSPCIVESDANIKVAARRIAVTKFSNAGQMCVAPDYLLLHEDVKDKFLEALRKTMKEFYGADPSTSESYGRIINRRQMARLLKYLQEGQLVTGGKYDEEKLYMEPTIIDLGKSEQPGLDKNLLLSDEIFGPILPVLSFRDFEEARKIIELNPNPLAFYVFTSSEKKEQKWLETISFGGGCVNNASWHLTNHHLPFGGRGNSGFGAYHGKQSFDLFSHKKSIMKTPTWFDPGVKYPPFRGKLWLFKKIIR